MSLWPADNPPAAGRQPEVQAIQTWLVERLSDLLGLAPDSIDVQLPFENYGLSSREAITISGELEEWLGRNLSPTLIYEYPNIAALAGHLAPEPAKPDPPPERLPVTNSAEPLAMIGIGCRFPGAHGPDEFWNLLRDGVNAITEVPSERWSLDEFYDPDPAAPGKMATRRGGFITAPDQFDPAFFNISPREAARMEPQQRLLMETVWEALEDAGQPPSSLAGTRTGVFIGISGHDYTLLQSGDIAYLDAYAGTGNALSIAANRLSYFFDFRGPSLAIDTACSSSLTAVHLAAQSLRRGESDTAIAGGVNLILSPEVTIALSHARMMAPDGQCKTFDASADGYVRGEGCGVIILKRLSDAVREGCPILALVRGTAVNQDGRTNGLTAPNGAAQQAVINAALSDAGVSPHSISYIEAHGTGTNLGDPIEVRALTEVMRDRPLDQPCLLGSVKTNIGHLESAAGIAGLIKTALALWHQEIPPHLHLRQINPLIPIDQIPFAIPVTRHPWPRDHQQPRRAGVSSFGFGGTNAHIILEEAPLPAAGATGAEPASARRRPRHLLSLSARSPQALKSLAGAYRDYLTARPETNIAELCFSAATGRDHFNFRAALTAGTGDELRAKLSALASGETAMAETSSRKPVIAFLLTGQGAQYAGMGRQLYDTQPVFRRTLDECAEILRPYLPEPLLSVMFPEGGRTALINETVYTQPALFAFEYALARLWEAWGVTPAYLLGHSVGEYVAACLAGVFNLEDGLKLIAARGRLMQSLPRDGGMLVVFAEPARVAETISSDPDELSIAAINGPASVVISGRLTALHEVRRRLENDGITTRALTVSHAFHSPLMQPILDEFEQIAASVSYAPPRLPVISNLTGRLYSSTEPVDAAYWRQHLREAVQFHAGMQTLSAQGCNFFLEIGPDPALTGMGRRCLPDHKALWAASLRQGQDEWNVLTDALATLYQSGGAIDWRGFDRDYHRTPVRLPNYQFQRSRYWYEPTPGRKSAHQKSAPTGRPVSSLLGVRLSSPLALAQYQTQLSQDSSTAEASEKPAELLSAAFYQAAMLAAADDTFGETSHQLSSFVRDQPLFLTTEPRPVQIVLTEQAGEVVCRVFSCEADGQSWTLHASAGVERSQAETESAGVSVDDILTRCPHSLADDEIHQLIASGRIQDDPGLRALQEVRYGPAEAAAQLTLPDLSQPRADVIYPLVLESCAALLSVLTAKLFNPPAGTAYFISAAESIRLSRRFESGQSLTCQAVLRDSDKLTADVRLLAANGECLLELSGASLQTAALAVPAARAEVQAEEKLTAERLRSSDAATRRQLLESFIRAELARVTGVAPAQLSLSQPLNTLGLDSIMAIEMKNRIESQTGLHLPVASLLQGPTVTELADQIAAQLQTAELTAGIQDSVTAASAEETEFPLSYGQRALWFQHQISPQAVYNIIYAVTIESELDLNLFRQSCEKLTQRHAVLRSTFHFVSGEAVQRIHADSGDFFRHVDVAALDEADIRRRVNDEAAAVFDLETGPLLRIHLFSKSAQEHVLLLTVHHLAVDLWSLSILLQELGMLYATAADIASLPPLKFRYQDYVRNQAGMLGGPAGEKMWQYWQGKLAGELPALELPCDHPRPAVQTYHGSSQAFQLSPEMTRRLKTFCEQQGVTMYMALLAAWQVLLSRYTGQEDIIVGSPMTGRTQPALVDLVGYFVNPVALRADLSGNPSFTDLLNQVRQTVLEALEHQDYPFPLLVERLQVSRDPGRTPIFQTMLVMQRAHLLAEEGMSSLALGEAGMGLQLGPLKLGSFPLDHRQAPFDLTLMLAETESGLSGSLCYNADLFEADTARRLLGHFETLLAAILENPATNIQALPLLAPAEREDLLALAQGTSSALPPAQFVHALFAERARRSPDAVAVVFGDAQLTYGELDARSSQLAQHLQKLGIGPDALVGIGLERSLEMIVGLLGVLKAGGAYVPLDPAYPADRLSYMLADTGLKVLLTQAHLKSQISNLKSGIEMVCLDADWPQIAGESAEAPEVALAPNHLAYVIYTSGSTGRPKGVMIEHRGLTNLILAQAAGFGVNENSRVLQFASFSFDASVSEIFLALTSGATLYLAQREQLLSEKSLLELLRRHAITWVTLPPSLLALFEPVGLPALQTVVSAGEACTWEIAERWGRGRHFFNAYGPTEATIGPTFYEAVSNTHEWRTVPIGRPISNLSIFLLDQYGQPVPAGVPGELCIGGIGLARGYLNQPELTAEKFINWSAVSGQWSVVSGSNGPLTTDHGQRLYRTGDQARWLPDGNLELIGRVDNQIKIRGFRIEPGEIENILRQHPAVRDAAVVVQEHAPGDKRLAAYLIPEHSQTVELWPSVAEFFVYDDLIYYALTHDELRNRTYKTAINRLVKDKVVVDIGTGKDAILARFCVEGGARKVYAIELMEETYQKARATLERLGLQDRITLIHGDAMKVGLPEPADVCVSEIVGAIGGAEGAAPIINNARRFLKPGGVMIPDRSLTLIGAVTLPDELLTHPGFGQVPGDYVRKIFAQVGRQFDLRLSLRGVNRSHLISNTAPFEDLHFNQPIEPEAQHDIVLTVSRDGRLDGLLVWLMLYTIDDAVIDILEHEHAWLPVWLPVFDPGAAVSAGDRIEATITRTLCENGLNPDFVITGRLIRQHGEAIDFTCASSHFSRSWKGTPFYERLFAHDEITISPAATARLPLQELRDHLRKRLPEYMVPSHFTALGAFPLTPNGKVDRKALAALASPPATASDEHIAPRNETEEKLIAIWKEVLGTEAIGINDNFFELGGHSLLLAKAHGRLQEVFERDLSMIELFKYPTIQTLAGWLRSETNGAPSQEALQRNLARAEKQKERLSQQQRLKELAQRRLNRPAPGNTGTSPVKPAPAGSD